MGRITQLKSRVRRWVNYDGAFYVLTMTREGLILKPYRARCKREIFIAWKEVFSPNSLPLFEEIANGKADTAPGTPPAGVEHDLGGEMPRLDGD